MPKKAADRRAYVEKVLIQTQFTVGMLLELAADLASDKNAVPKNSVLIGWAQDAAAKIGHLRAGLIERFRK